MTEPVVVVLPKVLPISLLIFKGVSRRGVNDIRSPGNVNASLNVAATNMLRPLSVSNLQSKYLITNQSCFSDLNSDQQWPEVRASACKQDLVIPTALSGTPW